MPQGVNRENDHHDRIENKNLFKHRSLKIHKKEFNILDNLLTSDILSSSHLRNDIYFENFQNELKPEKRDADKKIKFEPTSVTLVDLLGGKKQRQMTYEGLRVLLDTGCSDSLIRSECAKMGQISPLKNIYSTGGAISRPIVKVPFSLRCLSSAIKKQLNGNLMCSKINLWSTT